MVTAEGITRRSTGAAGRAFSQIKGFWPPPGYLGVEHAGVAEEAYISRRSSWNLLLYDRL